MLFEWDKNKNASNQRKHGVSFTEAKATLSDPKRVTKQDTRSDYGEDRFNTVGKSGDKLLNVTHTPRGEKTRIISARRAGKKEKKWYKF